MKARAHLIALRADMGDHDCIVFRKEFCPKKLLMGHRRNERELFRISVDKVPPRAHEELVKRARRKIEIDFPTLSSSEVLKALMAMESPSVPEKSIELPTLVLSA